MPSASGTFSPSGVGGRKVEIFLLLVVFVVVNLAGATFQKQITFNDGKAWEGEFYYDVAEQYAQGKLRVASEAPLVYRVGTPFLAAAVQRGFHPGNLFFCFKLVNLVANVGTLLLLIAWLRRFVHDWRVRTALGLMFLLQWDTPTRWLYFYPAHTDPWMWVFLLAGLLAIERHRELPTTGRLALVAVLGAMGVMFREVVLVVPVIFLLVQNPLLGFRPWNRFVGWNKKRFPAWRNFLPLFLAVAALLFVRTAAHQTNGYSFLLTALHFVHSKPALVYLHGFFLAFGPVVWLPILYWRQTWSFLASRQHLAAYFGAFALLAFIGGTDTERLLYWSMPVVYILIGRALETHLDRLARPWWLLAVLVTAQLVASRAIFWPIPDHPGSDPNAWPVFTPFGSHVPFLQLYSYFDPPPLALASLAEYLLFGVALAAWLTHQKRADRQLPGIERAA